MGEVIRISNRLPKPDHLQWEIITREKFEQIGILKELQFREKKAGKCVKLSDGYEEVGPPKDTNNVVSDSNGTEINGVANGQHDPEKMNKRREGKYPKRRNPRGVVDRQAVNQRRGTHKDDVINGDAIATDKSENKKHERSKNKRGQNNRNQESIGIFVGRIPRTARVKELKDAIQERGLRTNNLVWKGVKGFALLYFDKAHTNLSEDEICIQLKDLKLGESVLNIEPDRRKDKNKENAENAREEDMGEAETEHVDVHVNNTENIDGIRKETSHKKLVNKVQTGKL